MIDEGEALLQTTTTDGTGYFEFNGLFVGSYLIKEVMQAGYVQTTPEADGDGVFKVMVDESGETVIKAVDGEGQETLDIWFGNDQIEGPGVRTPGFWKSDLGQSYWDWNSENDGDPGGKHGFEKQGDGFAENDLFHLAYGDNWEQYYADHGDYLLIGDWDFDGVVDNAEDGKYGKAEEWFADGNPGGRYGDDDLGLHVDDALAALQGDGTEGSRAKGNDFGKFELIERDLVAAWLNYMAGNPVDDGDGELTVDDAAYWIDQAIAYLNYDGPNGKKDLREAWNDGIEGVTEQSGSAIHDALDGWNNEGWLNGDYVAYAGASSTSDVSTSFFAAEDHYESFDAVA